MAIDPDTQAVLDLIRLAGRPPFETLTPDEARQAYAASRKMLQPPPEDVGESRDTTVAGPLGPIGIRLYRPVGTEASDVLPVLIWYHGGGWLLGDLDSHDVPCRRFANAAHCRVISVDYRMAPEHVFPAAVDDCATVTKFVIDNAASLGVDPTKVAVGGDSAGGNLAAVMALMSRDGALPPIAFQLLVYPATDMTMTTVSSTTIGPGVPLTSATMKWFIDYYAKGHENDWRASPIRAASIAGTPPALVLTCTHDPLRDEGIDYARRLEREGVRVVHLHYSDQIHGFMSMGRLIRAADQAIDVMARTEADALATWTGQLKITVYTDYKSPYAYLANGPIFQLAEDLSVTLDWRPYILDIPKYLGSARVDEAGNVLEDDRNAHQWRRVRYSYMDCRRQARKQGLIIRGTQKIWDSSLAAAGMLWAQKAGVFRRYHDAVFERFWRRELDIESVPAIAAVLDEAGALGFHEWADRGLAEVGKIAADAEAQGVFGVPSFIVNGELFWGREHLPDIRAMLS